MDTVKFICQEHVSSDIAVFFEGLRSCKFHNANDKFHNSTIPQFHFTLMMKQSA